MHTAESDTHSVGIYTQTSVEAEPNVGMDQMYTRV